MSQTRRGAGGTVVLGQVGTPPLDPQEEPPPGSATPEMTRILAEVKGQAQFLLYLADQIEDSLKQLGGQSDPSHSTFLCKVLTMYSAQLETKHQGLGDRIAEACQEVYVTVREYDVA